MQAFLNTSILNTPYNNSIPQEMLAQKINGCIQLIEFKSAFKRLLTIQNRLIHCKKKKW